MCRSIEEGGQRCPAHTRPRFSAALTSVQDLPPEAPPTERLQTLLALEEAACQYASTTEGQIAVPEAAALAQVQGHAERAALLVSAAERGMRLREANQEVARQVENEVERRALTADEYRAPVESNHFLARERKAEVAEEQLDEAKQALGALKARLGEGVRPCRAGACAACGHAGHDGRGCRQSVQVMSDLWENCSCSGHQSPTAEQVELAAAMSKTQAAWQETLKTRADANAYTPGDYFVVARGRKVPRGTTGRLIRLWDGQYGTRVLLRTDTGESVWVNISNVDRDVQAETRSVAVH